MVVDSHNFKVYGETIQLVQEAYLDPEKQRADKRVQWLPHPPNVHQCYWCNFVMIDPSRGVHGAAFNIDVIIDGALGTDGGSKITRESIEREETEEDLGAWDDVEEFHDGGDV